MNASRLKKQLWRRWRRWKRALWVGAACVAITILAWRGMQLPGEMSELLEEPSASVADSLERLRGTVENGEFSGEEPVAAVFREGDDNEEGGYSPRRQQVLQTIQQSGLRRTVHLKVSYVSGEEIQNLPGQMNPAELKELIAKHPSWEARISAAGDLWLEKRIADLSPAVKKEAYFGVDEHGNLTLFKGPPGQDEVLKTFFQMDMGSMKSSLPEDIWRQLQEGIRVQDIEEYNSVLSTFSDYARDNSEQVMQNKE
ncbi:BofC C-terminal domain-containing protein [Bacillus sp. FJAT-27264]|uniref:BofC C-terminal domain-containing protein n=1 Tax=Paenibacillus sp. (strain DSM 101736 / FJAT-27264) TaxID=1850362 RepID=UPI00111251B0|nr:BofC C-terminal domain-containing protein [Bacillus sp. FJAT-27264]